MTSCNESYWFGFLSPDGELVSPRVVLPAAERYGVVRDLDLWVAARAMDMAASGEGVHLNISAKSVGDIRLIRLLEERLHNSGIDPSQIVVEITETALMQGGEEGESFVRRLAELGCGIALDDFGTGSGSLMHLKQLPVTYLKIDVDFVRDLRNDSASQHLVRAVVNLAQGFGQRTVAEGVEDEDTLTLLRELGVDYAQGYYLGRPGPL